MSWFRETFYLPDVKRGARAEDIEESWFSWMEEEREYARVQRLKVKGNVTEGSIARRVV